MRLPTTFDTLIRQHLSFATAHPDEWKRFDTIYDHMIYYLCSMWGMSESEADDVVQQFRSHFVKDQAMKRYGHPWHHLFKPATPIHFAVYAVSVQHALVSLDFAHNQQAPLQNDPFIRMFIGRYTHRATGWWRT
jgi:hypothetical protein